MTPSSDPNPPGLTPAAADEAGFSEVVRLIAASRQRAMQAVNTTLIELYWQVGELISRKIAAAEWGDGVVDQLASYLARTQPGLRGFTRRNLFRMRQFYEAYRSDEIVSPLVTQLPWTHHLIILSQSKRPEERELLPSVARWPSREAIALRDVALSDTRCLPKPGQLTARSGDRVSESSCFSITYRDRPKASRKTIRSYYPYFDGSIRM